MPAQRPRAVTRRRAPLSRAGDDYRPRKSALTDASRACCPGRHDTQERPGPIGQGTGPGGGRRCPVPASQRQPGRRGPARHLRAAAFLRGVPARPGLHRAAGHHRPDLRHLPGRLPDERVPGHRGRLRRHPRRNRSPTCADCCTAGSGSTAMPCTSTCCMRRISSATAAGSRWPREQRDIVERGLALKKAGNAVMEVVGGRADPPGQRAAWAASTGPPPGPNLPRSTGR